MSLNWIDVNLVRLTHGNGEIEHFLIGDMNPRGGICDDCCDIADEDIVLRYAVAVDMEELRC